MREAWEEIGLEPEDVRLLGRMNDYITITRYRVTPVVGVMPWPYPLRPEPAEVERIFTIPLAWLAEPRQLDRAAGHSGWHCASLPGAQVQCLRWRDPLGSYRPDGTKFPECVGIVELTLRSRLYWLNCFLKNPAA